MLIWQIFLFEQPRRINLGTHLLQSLPSNMPSQQVLIKMFSICSLYPVLITYNDFKIDCIQAAEEVFENVILLDACLGIYICCRFPNKDRTVKIGVHSGLYTVSCVCVTHHYTPLSTNNCQVCKRSHKFKYVCTLGVHCTVYRVA